MALRRALLAVPLALLVAACGSGDDERAAPATATQERAPAQAQTEPAEPAERREQPVRADGEARVATHSTGLEVPWDIAFLPDGRALVTERPGRIRLVEAGGEVREEPVAEVETQALGEGGLLGIALDPGFADGHPFAYVYVTRGEGMELVRLTWDEEEERLTGEEVVLDGIDAGPIHDAGRLRFGPDDRLYLPTGDAGRGELAQDDESLNGKFLRLERDQYRRSTKDPEVISKGHRNPQGLDWQPGSGRLVATEHGPSGGDGPQGLDEINVIRRGENYGWPEAMGEDHGDFTAPAQLYVEAVAPSGAAFVRRGGSAWTGDYLVAMLRGTQLRRLSFDGARVTADRPLLEDRFGRLRAVVEAPDGSIWVTTSNRDGRGDPRDGDDRIVRIVPPGR
jgi:glucose/arabinose dehydrogenase